jgi:hypothetical protein
MRQLLIFTSMALNLTQGSVDNVLENYAIQKAYMSVDSEVIKQVLNQMNESLINQGFSETAPKIYEATFEYAQYFVPANNTDAQIQRNFLILYL